MTSLHAAVIGTGFVGPHHVDAIRRTGYANVTMLVGSDPGRTERRAAEIGVDRWSTDVDGVLAEPGIDVVHVCTPNNTHVPLALSVLQAGKHLVLEKPIATDLPGADEVVAAGEASGRHAMVALTYRGYPMVSRARSVVAEGRLGDLRLVRGAYIQDWLADPSDYNWRVDPNVGGRSRAIADIGTHWFDTAEFVSGLRVEAVLADLATFLPTRSRSLGGSVAFSAGSGPSEPVSIGSEDAASILLRFEGGVRGACVVSQVSTGHKNAFELHLDGARASLDWEQETPERLWVRDRDAAHLWTRDPGPEQPGAGVPWLPAGHPEGWGEALRDLLRPFYAAVAGGAPPTRGEMSYPTLEAGARSIAFVAAALESSQSGSWVSIRT